MTKVYRHDQPWIVQTYIRDNNETIRDENTSCHCRLTLNVNFLWTLVRGRLGECNRQDTIRSGRLDLLDLYHIRLSFVCNLVKHGKLTSMPSGSGIVLENLPWYRSRMT